MLIAVGEYGDQIIIETDFPGLDSSPQRFELEHSIFELHRLDSGVYSVKCGMFFSDSCDDMYLDGSIGTLINVKIDRCEL